VIPWWLQVAWIGLYVGGVLGIAQWIAGRRTANEYTRKFVHIATGNIVVPTWLLDVPLWLALTFSGAFCVVTLLSYRLPILGSLSGIDRRSWGTFFYALSIALLIAVCWPTGQQRAAVVGILVMTWGDALAALVGQALGRWVYTVFGVKKTVEGTLAMVATSFVVALAVLAPAVGAGAVPIALAVALLAAALEVVSIGGVDNLTVPLGSAALCAWLLQGSP